VRDGRISRYMVAPVDFGLQIAPLETLTGGDATVNAAILTAIFAGEPGPRRDVVLLNAAAVLVTAGLAGSIGDGIVLAAEAIDAGRVKRLVADLQVG
jgi:anthranilate phosphoribosyltransferase